LTRPRADPAGPYRPDAGRRSRRGLLRVPGFGLHHRRNDAHHRRTAL